MLYNPCCLGDPEWGEMRNQNGSISLAILRSPKWGGGSKLIFVFIFHRGIVY